MFCLTEKEGKRERRKLCPGVNFSLLGMPGRRGRGREEGGRENWTGNASKEALFHSPLPLPHLLKILPRQKGTQSGAPSLPSGGEKRRLMLKFYFGAWFLAVFCSWFLVFFDFFGPDER